MAGREDRQSGGKEEVSLVISGSSQDRTAGGWNRNALTAMYSGSEAWLAHSAAVLTCGRGTPGSPLSPRPKPTSRRPARNRDKHIHTLASFIILISLETSLRALTQPGSP